MHDFRTDVCLIQLRVAGGEAGLALRPEDDEANAALRTLCEAITKSACIVLSLEPGELSAELRPTPGPEGKGGRFGGMRGRRR